MRELPQMAEEIFIIRDAQIFQKSSRNLKILDAGKVTWSKSLLRAHKYKRSS
jgi:hypothetical protein